MKRIVSCLVILLVGFEIPKAGENHLQAERSDHQIRLKDGRILNYQEYGNRKGKLVLWFHGLNSSLGEAELIRQEIYRSGLRIVAVERPGIGKSTFDGKRTILDWVEDVEQLTDSLGYRNRPFGIIAVSGGSSYGCACALKLPHRVSHLALVSPYGPLNVPDVEPGNVDGMIRFAANSPNLARATIKALSNQLERNPEKVMRRAQKKYSSADNELVFGNPRIYQNRIKNLHRVGAQGPRGLLTDLRLHANDWGFELSNVRKIPVTIWSGGDDPIAPPSMSAYIHRQITGSRLITGEKDGHVTLLKNKAEAILDQFEG